MGRKEGMGSSMGRVEGGSRGEGVWEVIYGRVVQSGTGRRRVPRGSSWQLPARGVRLVGVGSISHAIRD